MPPRPTFREALRVACKGDVDGASCDESAAVEPAGCLGKSPRSVRSFHSEASTCCTTEPDDLTPSEGSAAGSAGARPAYVDLQHKDLDKHFVVGRRLGAGTFGAVHRATCRRSGRPLALKTVRLQKVSDSLDVDSEIKVASALDHRNVVKLCAFFREEAARHMVMELCEGGDLMKEVAEYVRDRREAEPCYCSGLASPVAAGYMSQALAAVDYLHRNGFIHRDIKPANFLIAGTGENKVLKLGDFGYACRISKSETLSRQVGTLFYKAPEMHEGCYDQRADIWSLGVTCFKICTNAMPFPCHSMEEYVAYALRGTVQLHPTGWAGHFVQLRRLAMDMLTRLPESRPDTRTLLSSHAWLEAHGK